MGITRDKFLLRFVTFSKRDEVGNYTVNYKGQHIGDVVESGGVWRSWIVSKGVENSIIATEQTRHNASEALLDAWISVNGE